MEAQVAQLITAVLKQGALSNESCLSEFLSNEKLAACAILRKQVQ